LSAAHQKSKENLEKEHTKELAKKDAEFKKAEEEAAKKERDLFKRV
jgi:hypothetical protein